MLWFLFSIMPLKTFNLPGSFGANDKEIWLFRRTLNGHTEDHDKKAGAFVKANL